MITVKHIDTIDGIQDLIFEQTYNETIGRTRSSYFYRGMRNVSYDLTTSLSRNCKDAYAKLEQPLLENFINYVRIEDTWRDLTSRTRASTTCSWGSILMASSKSKVA